MYNTLGPAYNEFGYNEHMLSVCTIHWVQLTMSLVTTSTCLQRADSFVSKYIIDSNDKTFGYYEHPQTASSFLRIDLLFLSGTQYIATYYSDESKDNLLPGAPYLLQTKISFNFKGYLKKEGVWRHILWLLLDPFLSCYDIMRWGCFTHSDGCLDLHAGNVWFIYFVIITMQNVTIDLYCSESELKCYFNFCRCSLNSKLWKLLSIISDVAFASI